MKKLSDKEIQEKLAHLKYWVLNSQGQIEKKYEFKDFKESIFFVNAVAFLAEKLNHHPDILVLWNKVILSVNTHDAGGITHLDFTLAESLDETLVKK